MGCRRTRGIRAGYQCLFHDLGFWQDRIFYAPCKVCYHLGCLSVGEPFSSRFRDARRGLDFNPHMVGFPFICEFCTVRGGVGRKLEQSTQDLQLLMLERMRMIDASNSWASGTRSTISSKMRTLRKFLNDFSIREGVLLPEGRVKGPPNGPALPLLWAMEHYVLQPSRHKFYDYITYNTARGLRTCLHQYLSWQGSLMTEGKAYREKDRLFMDNDIGASGSLIVQLSVKGMENRLGTANKPAVALQHRHVVANQQKRAAVIAQYRRGTALWFQVMLAQLAELLAWLGWLRALELFGLRWQDVECIPPGPTPAYGLPAGSGALLLQLLEATKSSQTSTADMVISYRTASGLTPGALFEKIRNSRPLHFREGDPIFVDEAGEPWTSAHFRKEYVYPYLEKQLEEGDALMRTHAPEGLDQIKTKFYSLCMYRRGGRSHVSRKRAGCVRKATETEINEHGRWRIRYKVHNHMPTHYLEYTYEDKIYLTLLCM